MDLTAVYIPNLLSIILLLIILACNSWRFRDINHENAVLFTLISFGIISCIADPIAYTFDGKPGTFAHAVVYMSNSWLYFANVACSAVWLFFISRHLDFKITKEHLVAIIVAVSVAMLILVANIFVPVAFSVGEANVYSRQSGYWLFFALTYSIMVDSIIIYFLAKRRGGVLKFFPVWVYITPIVIGGVFQTLFFGVSVIWAGVAIGIAGAASSLQNELMFRDKLTGIYNRFYLDSLKIDLGASKSGCIGAMMIDLNGFKQINDSLGHSVGDMALRDAAEVMRAVIGTAGSVVRYAGDEFVILVNTQDQDTMDGYVDALKEGFYEFNESMKRQYRLSISVGAGIFDLRKQTVDEVMNEIDKRMYMSKRMYYQAHDRRSLA